MLFSVIIPLYNCASYLTDTIASLASQTFTDFEVIAVDDGSSDDSLALARDLLVKYRLMGGVYTKEPDAGRGVSSTRNAAIEKAQGEWICFLDSDDLFHSEKLALVSGVIRANPTIEFYHHPVYRFDEGSKPDLRRFPEVVPGIDSDEIYDRNCIVTSSVAVKRDLVKSLGKFNETLNGVEDYHLWLKVSVVAPLRFIPETIGFYQVRQSSLMGNRRFSYYVAQSILLLGNVDFLPEEAKRRVEIGTRHTLMTFYSNTSIQEHGYRSIFPGLFRLMSAGYLGLAMHIFFVKSRNVILYRLTRALSKKEGS